MSGKPAARLGDFHTCPQWDGDNPHVGGAIFRGSTDVLIGGQPAARLGDMAQCNAPPDSLAQGSNSVFINGRPAVRLGDGTAHGGVVVAGCDSVLIGDDMPRPALLPPKRKGPGWIAFTLVTLGVNGEEIPYEAEPFEASLTNGARSGNLDDDGRTDHDPLPDGECSIRFPNFLEYRADQTPTPDDGPDD